MAGLVAGLLAGLVAGLPTAVVVQGHRKAVEKGQNPKINRVGLALSLVIGKVKGKSKNLIRKMKIRKTRPRKNTLF